MILKFYSLRRIWDVLRFLLSIYLLTHKRRHILGIRPLAPQALHDVIVRLGASFVKLAQVLATRSDFFAPPYLKVLKSLHDELPPMSKADFESVVASASLQERFAAFETEAIASASIGQVHVATLHDGTKVAVKLRRRHIEAQIRADIRIVTLFNTLFMPLFSHYTKHSIQALVAEFSQTILQEVSLNQERTNLKKFSQVYSDQKVRFPKAYDDLSCDDALVMSYEEGVRFDDKAALERLGIDFMPLIDKLVRFYTEQMLVRGYFHADPHPGNLLVSPEGELVLLDFGMVKRVPNNVRVAIIELIQSAHERDYERYVSASKRMGTVTYEAPQHELAEFTERMFDIFDDDALNASSMQELAFSVMDQTRNLPFKLPQEAIYILRVSAIIEGLGTTYIENFNGIKDILPILQRNIPRALGASESILESIEHELKALPNDLRALRQAVHKASEGSLEVELSKLQLSWFRKLIDDQIRAIATGVLFVLAAIFLLQYERDFENVALVLFSLGALRLMYRK